uniref:ABC transporter domain-containing protein n=1 Tax=viral metagenome TaxID=1070528 RepID=A0A6C0LUM0_9ZZZZ
MPRQKKSNQKESKKEQECDYKNFTIENITIEFGKLKILDDTTLIIQYGEHYGLVGKNGIGKTSLLNAIYNRQINIPEKTDMIYVKQEEPESELSVIDIILSSNEELHKKKRRLDELQYIIDNGDMNDNIFEEYEKINHDIGNDFDRSKVDAQKILNGLGFDKNDQIKKISEFSGGWRMRISLAKALFMTPTLLILDEPNNHLDLHAIIWLTNYLKKYPKTILLVSHDRYLIDETCTVIMHINNKKINYSRGNYDQFEKNIKIEKEKYMKDWEVFEKKILAMKKAKKDQFSINEFIKKSAIMRPEKEYKVTIKFLESSIIKGSFIMMENISFNYDNKSKILRDLNLEINPGVRMSIVGKNGIGKSTLLKLICGEILPTKGEIIRSSVLRIGYYNQHFENSMPLDMTPFEYLMDLNKEIDLTTSHKYLSMFGLEPSNHSTKIGKLSGGQKARVKFASFGIIRPHILLLDEPSNHLDISTLSILIDGLNDYKGAIILITHNFDLITKLNSELWVISDGKFEKYKSNYDNYIHSIMYDD